MGARGRRIAALVATSSPPLAATGVGVDDATEPSPSSACMHTLQARRASRSSLSASSCRLAFHARSIRMYLRRHRCASRHTERHPPKPRPASHMELEPTSRPAGARRGHTPTPRTVPCTQRTQLPGGTTAQQREACPVTLVQRASQHVHERQAATTAPPINVSRVVSLGNPHAMQRANGPRTDWTPATTGASGLAPARCKMGSTRSQVPNWAMKWAHVRPRCNVWNGGQRGVISTPRPRTGGAGSVRCAPART